MILHSFCTLCLLDCLTSAWYSTLPMARAHLCSYQPSPSKLPQVIILGSVLETLDGDIITDYVKAAN